MVGRYSGRKNNQRAQSTLELALLFIIIAAALLTAVVYVKRSIQGRLRSAADDIGEQYSPALMNAETTIQTDSRTDTAVAVEPEKEGTIDAASTTTTITKETTTRTGHQELGEYKDEPFFFE